MFRPLFFSKTEVNSVSGRAVLLSSFFSGGLALAYEVLWTRQPLNLFGLTTTATAAKLAARNALNGDDHEYDATAMPAVTFTDPQVSSVDLTEREARDRGMDVKTSVLGLEHVPRALAARDTRGLIKLVADKTSDRLLGAHMIAPEAGDCIQTAAMAIKSSMTTTDLGDMIFPYLTTVEGLKLAAQTFNKDVSKLSCCAG